MGKLNLLVIYDRWDEAEEPGAVADKAPLTRTLDKKEVEGGVVYVLEMTSQAYLTTNEVDRSIWKHWIIITRPR